MKFARLRPYGIVLSAPVLLAVGCLIPYTSPNLSYLPAFELGSSCADCRVFRFDAIVHQTDNRGEYGEYTLTELVPGTDGVFPSQTAVSLDHKNLVVGCGYFSEHYEVGLASRTRLRLYRPGYHLVELGSWDSASKIRWLATIDWSAQEKAIDELLSGPPAEANLWRKFWFNDPKQLPKVASGSLKETGPLLFAAEEYERVAKIAQTPADAARLREKAGQLRAATQPKSDNRPTTSTP